MSEQKEKVKYLLGDKPPLDSTIKTVNMTAAMLVGLVSIFFAISVMFILIWRNFPLFPVPPSELPITTHLYHFWRIMFFSSPGDYAEQLYKWKMNDWYPALRWRYIVAVFCGLFIGGYIFKSMLRPISSIIQVAGKVLYEAQDAFWQLIKELNFLSANGRGSGLVVSVAPVFDHSKMSVKPKILKYDPRKDDISKLKQGTYVELPEKLRRSHSMVVGGTGRGKSLVIYYRLVAQLAKKIKNGERIKLLIADTPKSDYSVYFDPKDKLTHIIAPHEEGSVCWDIAKDLSDSMLAQAFWKGKIPTSDSDPIWGNSAITIGTGCTRFLQMVAPGAWNYGMLAYMLTVSGEDLKPILEAYYPEAKQILNAQGETLNSVMFNLGSYTTDLIELGRIYDGFDEKRVVKQATADALKNDEFVDFIYKELVRSDMEPGKETQSMTKAIMFKGACRYLTKTNPNWKWKDFAAFVSQSKSDQRKAVATVLDTNTDMTVVGTLAFSDAWKKFAEIIVYYADEWDKLEGKPKLSIRDWIVDENPKRKILILKPSESYSVLTDGLIKGILYYTNSMVLGTLQNDKKRKFHILIDEFQSYGDMKPFIAPTIQQYRSRGVSVTLAFQDLSQMVEIYGQEFVHFMSSSIGNTIITGVSDGDTANKLSDMIGNKKIQKPHRTRSADGGISEDIQEHEEKVFYPNKWNLIGANEATMTITYVNLFSGLNGVYMMKAPILDYAAVNPPKPAKWIGAPPRKSPILPDLTRQWNKNYDMPLSERGIVDKGVPGEPPPLPDADEITTTGSALSTKIANAFEGNLEVETTLEEIEEDLRNFSFDTEDESDEEDWNRV